MSVQVIKCKNGNTFAGCVTSHIDAEWKLQTAYYKAQGCLVETRETTDFQECGCEHCKSLENDFDELIEEIKSDN